MTASPARTKHTPRVEDDALVRGAGRFMDDPRLPNTAYAAFVRSPHAHARIVSVKTEEARKAKKVLAVLTAEDMKAANVGSVSRHPPVPGRGGAKMIMPFRPSLAGEKVMHVGDPVAMVVAETTAAAQDAADLVQVEYEELPPVIDLRDAMKKAARSSIRKRPEIFASIGRACARRTERARGRRDHRKGAARGEGERDQPAHGGRLHGDARRHRRLRQGERQLHALRLLAERRLAAQAKLPPSWACRTKSCA